MFETLEKWDRELFIYLNQLGSASFDTFWIFVTKIENWIFLYGIFLISIWKYFKKKEAILVSLFTVLTFLISYTLKIFNTTITA